MSEHESEPGRGRKITIASGAGDLSQLSRYTAGWYEKLIAGSGMPVSTSAAESGAAAAALAHPLPARAENVEVAGHDEIRPYRPSGRIGFMSLPLGLLFGAAAAVGGAWGYQLLVEANPIVYLNALATLVFALLVGALVGFGLVLGKCRNRTLAFLVGLLAGGAGEVASFWFAYERTTQGVEAPQDATEDTAAVEELEAVSAAGDLTASIRSYLDARAVAGWTLTFKKGKTFNLEGVWVRAVWIVEAAVLLLLAGAIASAAVRSPFCERCKKWLDLREMGELPGVDPAPLLSSVESGDLGGVLAPATASDSDRRAGYGLHECGECDVSRFLTVKLLWAEGGKKGRGKERERVLVRAAAITDDQAAALERRLGAR